jgi:phage/plasmid-like protein (TIGR03299 family)
MTANIAQTDGKFAVFTAGQAAWHGLGENVQDAQTWERAIELAGLDWQVEKRQLALPLAQGTAIPIDAYGIFRNDVSDAAQAFLGTCGANYEPIQNRTAFDFVDVLLEAQSGAHYDSAGALGKGERFWVSARLPFAFDVAGDDKHETYMLFASSHDSSMSAIGKLVSERVVCQNTLTVALRERGAQFKIKHTKDASKRLEAARQLMKGAQASIEELREKFNVLASRKLTKDLLVSTLDKLFPKDDAKKHQTRRENTIQFVLDRYEFNDANTFANQRGTAFNLLNAVTGYVDHERGVRLTEKKKGVVTAEQIRAELSVFGAGEVFKQDAFSLILEATKNAPQVAQRALLLPPVTRIGTAGNEGVSYETVNATGDALDAEYLSE